MSQANPNLEAFIREANIVRSMTQTEGWQILRRDIDSFLSESSRIWCLIDKNHPKFDELRVQTIACRKLISMTEDYEANRIKAEHEWLRQQFPEMYVQADVDNDSPLNQKED